MACFAIAAVLQAFKLEEIEVSGLSMDEWISWLWTSPTTATRSN
jgi:hypothetical protein